MCDGLHWSPSIRRGLGRPQSLSLLVATGGFRLAFALKFIKDDFYINLFDGIVYIFDRSLEIRGRFDIEFVDKFVRVRKE